MVWYALFVLMMVLTGFFILVLIVTGFLNDDTNSWAIAILILQVIVGACIGISIGIFWKISEFKNFPKGFDKAEKTVEAVETVATN